MREENIDAADLLSIRSSTVILESMKWKAYAKVDVDVQ